MLEVEPTGQYDKWNSNKAIADSASASICTIDMPPSKCSWQGRYIILLQDTFILCCLLTNV